LVSIVGQFCLGFGIFYQFGGKSTKKFAHMQEKTHFLQKK